MAITLGIVLVIATRQHPTEAPASTMIQPAIASSPLVDVDALSTMEAVTIPVAAPTAQEAAA